MSALDAQKIIVQMTKLDGVLGILDSLQENPLPAGAQELIDQRQMARVSKDWALADALKQELLQMGIQIKDTPTGTVAKVV